MIGQLNKNQSSLEILSWNTKLGQQIHIFTARCSYFPLSVEVSAGSDLLVFSRKIKQSELRCAYINALFMSSFSL